MSDLLTVVVAACNEAESLPRLHPRIIAALEAVPGLQGRVLYVDDGSSDGTWPVLQRLVSGDVRVGAIRLSRNFGKELALTAGLDQVTTGAALLLDADGQDPPELIAQFVALWREGYDNVFGTRRVRAGESWIKRAAAASFYRVIGRLSRTPIPADTGDFRLLSPRALAALHQLRERHRFMKGLFGWVGFRQVALPYDRSPRLAGSSKFTLWKLWNFALEGITSFSTAPLRVATYLGLFTAVFALAFAVWVVVKAALWGDPVAGWPTMMAVILFLGGVQLIALGLIGEYLGRLYDEAKLRPLYFVDTRIGGTGVSSGHPSRQGASSHVDGAATVGDEEG
ncbi:glycosyl transferase family 2 [Stenotrophomonas panacihumi]|uniref:Glycosyl transferase family 2 n=1 Tax=Stenotrophomonas panacihumi TaxID=676599 RepID=A0A0R0B0T6_9GAMM|nr:glycosyltransferase family 2 protein [Stenotrophomonas panacihumi]KRG46595.1 glycosyl transferase family 2 [Stenotrophomonas panacihumi]PTN53197.1 glycosyltransferase [Stenotrophomonas panacihumi]